MFEFLKKLFNRKDSQCVAKPDFITATTPKSAIVSNEKDILSFFSQYSVFVDKVIVPVSKIAKGLGLDTRDICYALKEGFQLYKKEQNGQSLDLLVGNLKNEIVRTHNNSNLSLKAEEMLEMEDFFDILFVSDEDWKSYRDSSIQAMKGENGWWIKLLEKFRLKITFFKFFSYIKLLSNIEQIEEFSLIICNAINKFNDITIAVEKTYNFLFDYIKIPKHRISYKNYKECLMCFWRFKQLGSNFYEINTDCFNFDIFELNLRDITEKIVELKLYRQYDVEKLLKGILYKKLKRSNSLEETIGDFLAIDRYIERLKNYILKEDLLNNDYSNRITIVDIDLMSGVQFEEFLCEYFNGQGYQCSTTKASGDQGIVLIAKKGELTIAIQAKCYSGTVGNHAIMEAVAGMKYYSANRCMVITNSTFSKSAIELAKANGVILWDRQVLTEKLNNI